MGTPRHAVPWSFGNKAMKIGYKTPNSGLTSRGRRLRVGNEKEFGGPQELIPKGMEGVLSASSTGL